MCEQPSEILCVSTKYDSNGVSSNGNRITYNRMEHRPTTEFD
jgi:hypothetical protein